MMQEHIRTFARPTFTNQPALRRAGTRRDRGGRNGGGIRHVTGTACEGVPVNPFGSLTIRHTTLAGRELRICGVFSSFLPDVQLCI